MGVLDGIRVLELASFITGPYAGMLLGDLGAEVIKVEVPETGDPFRAWGDSLWSTHFCAFNRNKRSMTLNLLTEGGREVFRALVRTADVLVENYRPGVTTKLGINYPQVSQINPRLVYCSITAFGPSGPYRDRPGYDTVAQGTSGMLSLMLEDGDWAVRGPALADSISGLTAAYGILGALVQRERTGMGCNVGTSMLSAMLSFLTEPYTAYLNAGRLAGPFSRSRESQTYVLRCKDDRRLALHLSSPDKFFRGLAESVGRQDLQEDPRFTTRESRVENHEALQKILAPIFATRSCREWMDRLVAADVPCTPVYTLDEALLDPHIQEMNVVQQAHHPQLGPIRAIANPIHYDDAAPAAMKPPPGLGEDTEAVIQALGFTATQIDSLRSNGAFAPPESRRRRG